MINEKKSAFKICGFMAMVLCMMLVLCGFENEPVGFSIRAVQSDKQVDKRASYFDLMLAPGEEHVLEVDIFNTSDIPLHASVTASTAGTNSGGVIDYTSANVTDDSLKVAFEDLAKVEAPRVVIPANGSSRVGITVKMPEEAFDGVMLGGIAVKKVEDEDLAAESTGTRIQNEYCYIIGVKIRENETEVAPELRLRNVGPKLSNYHTSIASNLQNYKSAIIKGINIDAAVYYNNESQPLYTNSSSNFDIAPNSNFDYIIPCSGKLAPGDYRLLLTASLGEKLWEFDETFTITGAIAGDINTGAVNIPAPNYYKIATICLLLILIIILILIASKRMYGRRNRLN